MRRVKAFCLATLLGAFLVSSPAMAVREPIVKSPDPAIENTIQELRKEIQSRRHTFSVGYSSAMEHAIEELCGLKEPLGWREEAPYERFQAPLATLPSSFDWRAQGGTTSVKNQKYCGDCWAFGTVGPLESQIKLQCNATVDLSEQYLTSCNTNNWGCDGGWWAHAYHMDKPGAGESEAGAVLEADFPFQSDDVPCNGPYSHPYRITNWAYLSGQPTPGVQALKQAIYTYGPISAAVYVGPKFQAYSSGIFNANEPGKVNHAIVLVGWNDDMGPDNGYWILRNSWGPGWGEDGYMRIRYGNNLVGYSANYIEFVCDDPAPPPPEALPELRVGFRRIFVSPNGHRVRARIVVKNAGEADAGEFKVDFYLSNDGTDKTLYLGNATVGGLVQGESMVFLFVQHVPEAALHGRYLLAVIDSDNQVEEKRESNNTRNQLIP